MSARIPAIVGPWVPDSPPPDAGDPTPDEALVAGFRDAQAGWPPYPGPFEEFAPDYLLGYASVAALNNPHHSFA